MKIRRATPQDAGALLRIHRASIVALASSDYTAEEITAWVGSKTTADYEELMARFAVRIAERAGRPVAFSALDLATGELHALYVQPSSTGLGAGTALLDAVEAEGRAEGLEAVALNATLNSVSFYASRGYASLGPATNTLPTGEELSCVRMRKHLR